MKRYIVNNEVTTMKVKTIPTDDPIMNELLTNYYDQPTTYVNDQSIDDDDYLDQFHKYQTEIYQTI